MKKIFEHKNNYLTYISVIKGLSQNTVECYNRDLKLYYNFVNSIMEKNYSIKECITYAEEFISYLLNKNLGYRSINRIISSVREFHKYLVVEKIIDENIWENIKKPKFKTKLPNILSVKQIKKLLIPYEKNEFLAERNTVMIKLCYLTGIRASELINIRIGDISFENNDLLITGKGNKQRLIPLTEEMKNDINNYLKLRNKICKNKLPYLFLSLRGKRLFRNNFNHILFTRSQSAGLKIKIYPHCLRHTFATNLLNKGLDIRIIQKLLGHEDISTTQVYMHLKRSRIFKQYKEMHPLNNEYLCNINKF